MGTSEFVSAPAYGPIKLAEREVVISFHGPRGGKRGVVGVDPTEAILLACKLQDAAAKLLKLPKPNPTSCDPTSWLSTIWDALGDSRDKFTQERWDEICTAMAWIKEEVDR